jgi:DNA-binding protein
MIRVGAQIPIQLQLFDGATGKFPRANVRDATGAAISGSPFDLTHIADGQYANTAAVMPNTPFVTVQMIVYSDAGRTIVDTGYSYAIDTFTLDNSALASTALDNTVWTNAKAAFLDAAISSRNSVAPDNASIATILSRTDVATSTRNAIAPDNAGIAAIKAKTDNLPSDPASNTNVATRAPASTALDNTVWTGAKAAFIDVAISSRNSVAPDNANIAAIKAKTDNLPASPANETTSAAIKAKTDNLPADPASDTTVNTRAPASTAVSNADLTAPRIANLDNLDVPVSSVGGGSLTVQDIVDGVWDEPIASHLTAGSTGEKLSTGGSGGGGTASGADSNAEILVDESNNSEIQTDESNNA